jgi:hypothetical protein
VQALFLYRVDITGFFDQLKRELQIRRVRIDMFAILYLLPKIVNKIKAIDYSGGTRKRRLG